MVVLFAFFGGVACQADHWVIGLLLVLVAILCD